MNPNSRPFVGLVSLGLAFLATVALAQDSLPSWNNGPAKQAVIRFVQKIFAFE
jgi:hypothetical protein